MHGETLKFVTVLLCEEFLTFRVIVVPPSSWSGYLLLDFMTGDH